MRRLLQCSVFLVVSLCFSARSFADLDNPKLLEPLRAYVAEQLESAALLLPLTEADRIIYSHMRRSWAPARPSSGARRLTKNSRFATSYERSFVIGIIRNLEEHGGRLFQGSQNFFGLDAQGRPIIEFVDRELPHEYAHYLFRLDRAQFLVETEGLSWPEALLKSGQFYSTPEGVFIEESVTTRYSVIRRPGKLTLTDLIFYRSYPYLAAIQSALDIEATLRPALRKLRARNSSIVPNVEATLELVSRQKNRFTREIIQSAHELRNWIAERSLLLGHRAPTFEELLKVSTESFDECSVEVQRWLMGNFIFRGKGTCPELVFGYAFENAGKFSETYHWVWDAYHERNTSRDLKLVKP